MTSASAIWPRSAPAYTLLNLCDRGFPALFDALAGPFSCLALQVDILVSDAGEPLALAGAKWLKSSNIGTTYLAPTKDLSMVELLAIAQIGECRDLLSEVLGHLPNPVGETSAKGRYSLLISDMGVLLHSLDTRRLAKDEAAWHAQMNARTERGSDFDAALVTFLPFLDPKCSAHHRLVMSGRIATFVANYLDRVSLVLPGRCRITLDRTWHLPD